MSQREQFDSIYREYYKPLFVFAKRYLEASDDCHDLVNDVFEYLWSHFDCIHPPTLQAFLYQLLRSRCIDFLRRKKTEQKFVDYAMASSERFDSSEHIRDLQEREQKIREVLNSLPITTRTIFTLCFVEHKKYAEVAEKLGISPSTVKKHIVMALKIIREGREKN